MEDVNKETKHYKSVEGKVVNTKAASCVEHEFVGEDNVRYEYDALIPSVPS